MLKSKWLSLVLDVDFMTLSILKFIFLEFIIYLKASSQNFVRNHQFHVFYQNLNQF